MGFLNSTNDAFTMIPANLEAPGATGAPPAGTARVLRERVAGGLRLARPHALDVEQLPDGHAERADDGRPDLVHGREHQRPAAGHDEHARLAVRPADAEGAVPQGRQRGVALGHAHGRRHERARTPARSGPARRDRRHDRHDSGAAADLPARLDHSPLDAEHRGGQGRQRRDRLLGLERRQRDAGLPGPRLLRPARDATRRTSCRRPRRRWSREPARRRATAAGARVTAGATTAR